MEGAWIPKSPCGGQSPVYLGLFPGKTNFYGSVNESLGFICYGRKKCPDQYTNEIHFPSGRHYLLWGLTATVTRPYSGLGSLHQILDPSGELSTERSPASKLSHLSGTF